MYGRYHPLKHRKHTKQGNYCRDILTLKNVTFFPGVFPSFRGRLFGFFLPIRLGHASSPLSYKKAP